MIQVLIEHNHNNLENRQKINQAMIYKTFSCSTQLSMLIKGKCFPILLINVKMPTFVDILTFMSRITFKHL